MRARRESDDPTPLTPREVLRQFVDNAAALLPKGKARLSTRTLLACLELSQTAIVILDKRGSAILCNSSFRAFAAREASMVTISARDQIKGPPARAGNPIRTDCCQEVSSWLDAPAVRWTQFAISSQRIRIGRKEATAYSLAVSAPGNGVAIEQAFLHDLLNAAASVQMLIDLTEEAASDQSRSEYLKQLRTSMGQVLMKVEHESTLLSYSGLAPSVREIFEMFISHHRQLAQVPAPQLEILREPTEPASLRTADVLGLKILDRLVDAAVRATGLGGLVSLSCSRAGAEVELRVHFPGDVPPQIRRKFFGASLIETAGGKNDAMRSHTRYDGKRVSMHFGKNSGTTLTVRCAVMLEKPVPRRQSKTHSVPQKKCG